MSRTLAAGMILLYQRHVSPRKGFGCPRRVLRGRLSCAEFARRAMGRVGLFRLVPLMRRRFAQCAAARKATAVVDPRVPAASAGDELPLDYQGPRPPTGPQAGAAEEPRVGRADPLEPV